MVAAPPKRPFVRPDIGLGGRGDISRGHCREVAHLRPNMRLVIRSPRGPRGPMAWAGSIGAAGYPMGWATFAGH